MSAIGGTIRTLGVITFIALILALGCILWIGLRIVTYESADDADHLEAKNVYLDEIREATATDTGDGRPNIVVILFDDLGYGDLGLYGSQVIETPNIDALAATGLRLDHYYAASPVCTSSRAALLTGRYPPRAGLNIVAFPTGDPLELGMRAAGVPATRLPAEEILLPEILSAAGYETGMVGKWHLGDRAPSRPLDRGLDSYLGALYSNDMTPFAIYEGNTIRYEAPFDQTQMKRVYMEAAVEFLERERERPFFFYFAHNFPHIPLFTPDSDIGRSDAGLYGDVVEGLDDAVGAVVAALERSGELDDTLILLTSDNGPWFEGSPGAIRGRKGTTWEGGMRVPFIAHWPARIAAGRESDAPTVAVDIVPTVLALLDLPAPPDRMLDGVDVGPHLFDGEAASDRQIHYFGVTDTYDAVRNGRFKYHRRRGVRSGGSDTFSFNEQQGPWLFDLDRDPNESYDVSRLRPEQAERMAGLYRAKRQEMEDNPRGWR